MPISEGGHLYLQFAAVSIEVGNPESMRMYGDLFNLLWAVVSDSSYFVWKLSEFQLYHMFSVLRDNIRFQCRFHFWWVTAMNRQSKTVDYSKTIEEMFRKTPTSTKVIYEKRGSSASTPLEQHRVNMFT